MAIFYLSQDVLITSKCFWEKLKVPLRNQCPGQQQWISKKYQQAIIVLNAHMSLKAASLSALSQIGNQLASPCLLTWVVKLTLLNLYRYILTFIVAVLHDVYSTGPALFDEVLWPSYFLLFIGQLLSWLFKPFIKGFVSFCSWARAIDRATTWFVNVQHCGNILYSSSTKCRCQW